MGRKKVLTLLGLVALAILFYAVYLLVAPKKVTSPAEQSHETEATETEVQPEPENPKLINVQPVIDAWDAKQTGTYSIVVYDLENDQIVGEKNKDKVYFAASIYKLYVAYEGYLAAQRGDYNLNESYLDGQTREQCLDKMLRESDSPCAEKLWAELGKTTLTTKLKTYGINNTSMTNITTTAQDASLQLIRLWQNAEFSDDNKAKFLDSMKDQDALYRRGLPSGMPGAVVHNKVGWNELKEWHDVAIVSLPNNRNYVISLFTENVGTSSIRALSANLQTVINVDEPND